MGKGKKGGSGCAHKILKANSKAGSGSTVVAKKVMPMKVTLTPSVSRKTTVRTRSAGGR